MNDPASYPPPSPDYAAVPRAKKGGCFRGFLMAGVLAMACIGLLVVLVIFSFATLASRLGGYADTAVEKEAEFGEDEFPELTETWSSGQGDTKVVRIALRGSIFLGQATGPWSGSGDDDADAALRAIRRATLDPKVAGLLLEVDSGGGGITASDILYNALLEFKRTDTNRVIVAHMGDMAASGAYYICLAADHVMAHPTTVTGSIGVILTSINMREMIGKLGIKDVSVKSGDNKDLLNPFIDMTPDQRAMLQQLVDALHSRFVMLVARHRELPEPTVRELADGRIFLAPQAEELGLIDGLGYTAEAEAAVAELLGHEVRFVRYSQQVSLRDLLRSPAFWGAAFSELIPRANQQPAFLLR